MVPEIPLDEYVKNFRYLPPAEPAEITMRGDPEVLRTEAPAVSDVSPTVPPKVTNAADVDLISATEDIDERLGLGESAPDTDDERPNRPRFLDFNEPAQPEKAEVPAPAKVGPSFLEVGDKPPVAAPTPDGTEAAIPRGDRWTWVAVAALLGFVALGVLEWRSQVNQTNHGPVEVLTMKLRNIWRGTSPTPEAERAAEASITKPAAQIEDQSKPQPQDQPVPANSNAPSSAMASNPPASDANPSASVTSSPQSTPSVNETKPPAGQKIAAPTLNASADTAQSAAEQKPTQPKPTPPPNSSKAVIASENIDVVQTSTAKPKPKAQAAQEGDSGIAAKKPVPGQEEMAKAKDASDAAAAAAWLWKATAKGNPDAPARLADMYVKGDGVPRSCEQALVLLQAAAAKENAPARTRLAEMYNSGTCVQRNLVKAYRWLSAALAADPNSHWALRNRDLIWQQLTPEERAAAQQSP
jgi:hypothetical protein